MINGESDGFRLTCGWGRDGRERFYLVYCYCRHFCGIRNDIPQDWMADLEESEKTAGLVLGMALLISAVIKYNH